MSYATLDDIETRYPGELAQAGPKVDGALDEAAVSSALYAADQRIDGALRTAGLPAPTAPYPEWIKATAVDLALYFATPTVLASQTDFADRRDRYRDAIALLDRIADGKWLPPTAEAAAAPTIYCGGKPRLFGRGAL